MRPHTCAHATLAQPYLGWNADLTMADLTMDGLAMDGLAMDGLAMDGLARKAGQTGC